MRRQMMGLVLGRASVFALVAALTGVTPGPLRAQRIATFEPVRPPLVLTGATPERQETPPPAAPSRGRLGAGSALGSAVGALAGWTVGVLFVVAVHGSTNNFDDAFAAAAVAGLLGSGGAVVLGGLGSRIGVRAAGGQGGPLGKHILASLAGWGASLVVVNALYSNSNDPNVGAEFGVLVGTHGLVTALLAPKR